MLVMEKKIHKNTQKYTKYSVRGAWNPNLENQTQTPATQTHTLHDKIDTLYNHKLIFIHWNLLESYIIDNNLFRIFYKVIEYLYIEVEPRDEIAMILYIVNLSKL